MFCKYVPTYRSFRNICPPLTCLFYHRPTFPTHTLLFSPSAPFQVSTRFDFIPSPGIHIMLYKNRFIRVQRERENKMINFDTGTPWETVTLSTVGTSRQLFVDMLQEAREFGLQGSEGWSRTDRHFSHFSCTRINDTLASPSVCWSVGKFHTGRQAHLRRVSLQFNYTLICRPHVWRNVLIKLLIFSPLILFPLNSNLYTPVTMSSH